MTRRKRFGIVEVCFATEEEARQYSTLSLNAEDPMLVPTYHDRCAMKVKIGEMPPELDYTGWWRLSS